LDVGVLPTHREKSRVNSKKGQIKLKEIYKKSRGNYTKIFQRIRVGQNFRKVSKDSQNGLSLLKLN